MASPPRAVAPALDTRVPHSPPSTHLVDLAGLAIGIAGGFFAHPRDFSLRVAFRAWARGMMGRYGSENLILNLGVKKLLLVGGSDLSRQILESPPTSQQYVTGSLKRNSMAFLAPHALTISDGQQWRRLRPLNERVLESGRPHEFRQAFLTQVHSAFTASPETTEEIRAAMGRTMLGVVFGTGLAPQSLADDVQALFQLVQQPVKRLLLGPWARRRRARFYATLRRAWQESASSPKPSLIALLHREAQGFGEEEVLEQIPHWMFTFTGSGTDLLVRTLTLLTSHPAALTTARGEIGAAGPLDQADTVDRLPYLEASLRESARLYPPVTRTFHRAAAGVTPGHLRLPAGLEILHSFPLIGAESLSADSRRFRPERWLSPDTAASAAEFDPFLHGARHCPGRELIMFVCKSALAILIGRHRVVVTTPLPVEALPPAFPSHGIRFRRG